MPQFDQTSFLNQVFSFFFLFLNFYFYIIYFFLPVLNKNLKLIIKKIKYNNDNNFLIELEKKNEILLYFFLNTNFFLSINYLNNSYSLIENNISIESNFLLLSELW